MGTDVRRPRLTIATSSGPPVRLGEGERLLPPVLRALPVPVAVVAGPDGMVLAANRSWVRLLGSPSPSLVEMWPEATREIAAAHRDARAATGVAPVGPLPLPRRDGAWTDAELDLVPHPDVADALLATLRERGSVAPRRPAGVGNEAASVLDAPPHGGLYRAAAASRLASFEIDHPLVGETATVSAGFRALLELPQDRASDAGMIRACLHPGDRRAFDALRARLSGAGGTFVLEVRAVLPDGSLRWLQLRGAIAAGTRATPGRLCGIAVDVTARVAAERALAEREEVLRRVQRLGRVGGFEIDLATGVNRRDEAYMMLHGGGPRAVQEEHADWVRRLHPADRERVERRFLDAIADDAPDTEYAQHYRIVTPAGKIRWVSARAEIARDPITGRAERVLGAHVDITELKEAETARAESEARLRLFIERAPAAIAMFDSGMRYLAASCRFLRDYGLDEVAGPEALIGRSHYDVFPAFPDHLRDVHRRVLAGETLSSPEDSILDGSGNTAWARWEMTPWRHADGSIGGALFFSEVTTQSVLAQRALRASEARFRALVEASGPIVFRADPDGAMVEAPGWTALTGQSEEELRGAGWLTHVHPEDAAPAAALCNPAGASAQPGRVRFRVRTTDDAWRWAEGYGVPVRGAGGAIDEWVGTVVDIHDQVLAEASAARSAELLRTVIESTPDLVWAKDAEGRIVLCNRATLDLLGNGRAEAVIGRDARDLMPDPEQAQRVMANDDRVLLGRQVESVEEPFGDRVFQTVKGPWRDGSGHVVGIVGVSRDITDQRRTEAALAAGLERLALAQHASGIAIYDHDLRSGRVFWDARMRAIWGVPDDVAISQEVFAAGLHPDDVEAVEAAFARALDPAGDSAYDAEYRVISRLDGVTRWVAASGRVAFDRGTALRHVGTVRDVTARRAAEAAMREGEARLKAALHGARLGLWERHLPSSRATWDARAVEIYGGLTPEECVGNPDNWRDRIHPDDRAARIAEVEAATAQGGPDSYSVAFRFRRNDGGWNWVTAHGTVVERDPRTGRGIRLAGVLQDLTDARLAEEALRTSEERLRLAQEAAGVGSWEWDIGSGALHWSESCYRLHGMDPARPVAFEEWRAHLHREDVARVEASLRAALAGPGSRWEIEFRFIRPLDGEERWIIGRGQVVREPVTRRALRVLGVGLDVTERRRAEERLVLLAREVDHRAKNALAVVQAAIRLAPKHDASAFAMAVEGRVAALARAQVLLAETGWRGAALRVVAEGALAAFLELGGTDRARAILAGPSVQLVPAAAQPVALALHELATNAAKYGALSQPGGRLALSWRVEEPAGLLRMDWVETGGPKVAGPPSRRGFGSRVIAATISEQLGGTVEHRWEASGLRCAFLLPMARVGAAGH